MKKSLTVRELKEKLNTCDDNLEVFVANSKEAQFDGITAVAEIISRSDNNKYIMLIADGDILKI